MHFNDFTYYNFGFVADKDVPTYIFGNIVSNLDNPYAPVKLFQRVKPIFYEADSLANY